MTRETTSRTIVDALVRAGLVAPGLAEDADAVVRTTLGEAGPDAATPMRRRMAEVAGYVGGAFVVGAAALFFAATWSDLGLVQQAGLLLGTALVLAGAGLALTRAAGGRAVLRLPAEAVRRRLTSVLVTGAAGCTAFGLGLVLGDRLADDGVAVLLAALAGLVVCLGGYALAPTSVGQLGCAVAAFVMVPAGLSALDLSSDGFSVTMGSVVLALGAGWLVAAERRWWHEALSARLIGSVLAVVGAQVPAFSQHAWAGYALTAGLGVAAFALYVGLRAWPYLATGVVAVTVAVPEAVNNWVGGSLGAAGVLLATGVTLLAAALLGLRLRQEAL